MINKLTPSRRETVNNTTTFPAPQNEICKPVITKIIHHIEQADITLSRVEMGHAEKTYVKCEMAFLREILADLTAIKGKKVFISCDDELCSDASIWFDGKPTKVGVYYDGASYSEIEQERAQLFGVTYNECKEFEVIGIENTESNEKDT